jgi:hypothetical protein
VQDALSGAAEMVRMMRGGFFTVLLYPRTFLAWRGVSGIILDILEGITEEKTRSLQTNRLLQTRHRKVFQDPGICHKRPWR